jgi:hypothetical protein
MSKEVINFWYKSEIILTFDIIFIYCWEIMQNRKVLLVRPRKYSESISEKIPTFFYCSKSAGTIRKGERIYGNIIME